MYVGLGDSRNPTHYDTMSGYAVANPIYILKTLKLSGTIKKHRNNTDYKAQKYK